MTPYKASRITKHAELLLRDKLTIRQIAQLSGWSAPTVQRDIVKAIELYPYIVDEIKIQLKENKINGSKKAAKKLNEKRWGVK